MSVHRKQYSAQFKAQVVQELLAGDKTLSQIASHYAIHPNVITKWRKAAVSALPKAFDEQGEKAIDQLMAQHEKEKEALYAEIGRLSTQLKWLEKKAASVGITLDQARVGRMGK